MASGWELGMGFGFGAPTIPAAAPNSYLYGLPSADTLRIDDLLDFSNHGAGGHEMFAGSAAAAADHCVGSCAAPESSAVGAGGFAGSHVSSSFADDIYVPAEEAAELEWLSKFVEESFSYAPYPAAVGGGNGQMRGDPTVTAPGRGARSQRSRAPVTNLAPTLIPNNRSSSSSSSTSSSSSSDIPQPHIIRGGGGRKKEVGEGEGGGVRRCTHCASEKTPQWRTGPLGPKTLCNACGVRYKSGRLVPEYRPAASPTFVLTQHSNSHRKVMELRRQKEQLPHDTSAGGDIMYHHN